MRILLDNCAPRPLRRLLAGHEVETAYRRGWAELANGDLLRAAAEAGFELLLTVDQNIQYQQNLVGLPLPVIILVSPSLDMDDLARCGPHLPEALARVADARRQNRCVLIRVSQAGILPD